MVRVLNLAGNGFMYVISRVEWAARDPTSEVFRGDVPFKKIIFTHTDTRTCKNRSECVELLKKLQIQHLEEGCSDIKHNFLVGGFGTVYEGRGWNCLPQKLQEQERNCLDIAYIGSYRATRGSDDNYVPAFEVLSSALSLVKYGLGNGFIDQSFQMGFKINSHVTRHPQPKTDNHSQQIRRFHDLT